MIEAKILLGAQEALLDGPAQPGSRSEFCQCGSGVSICEIIKRFDILLTHDNVETPTAIASCARFDLKLCLSLNSERFSRA